MTKEDDLPELVDEVLEARPGAGDRLWERIEPWVHDAVLSELERWRCGATRANVEDFAHDAAVRLFEDDCQVLRRWDRARPMRPYVSTICRHLVHSAMRLKKKNPNSNERLSDAQGEIPSDIESPEAGAAVLELRRKGLVEVERRLTRTQKAVLRSTLDLESTAELRRKTGMSEAAIATQRSRIAAIARMVHRLLSGEPERQ